MIKRMVSRARMQAGFGLIELIIALMILNIALLAIVGAFAAGAVSLSRASRVSTATAVANSHLEIFRAVTYDDIELNTNDVSTGTDATYRTEPAWNAQETDAGCPMTNVRCDASRTVTGADGRPYRLDTYIHLQTATGGRPLKRVTVVVRNPDALTGTPFIRQASSFDESF